MTVKQASGPVCCRTRDFEACYFSRAQVKTVWAMPVVESCEVNAAMTRWYHKTFGSDIVRHCITENSDADIQGITLATLLWSTY